MIVLLGVGNSKRTKYFLQAARAAGAEVSFEELPSKEELCRFDFSMLAGSTVKIDPPDFGGGEISALKPFMEYYVSLLGVAARVPGIRLLNSCEAIINTLDKAFCKRRLEEEGVPVTPMLRKGGNNPSLRGGADECESIGTLEELRECMDGARWTGVFIKPRFGSGAAGVIAYRRRQRTGDEVIYTSARLRGSGEIGSDLGAASENCADRGDVTGGERASLYNTKRIRRITDVYEIGRIVDMVLSGGAVAERWIPKASYGGKAYDLRVVYQFGHIAYMVARRSRGHITNLHLNNDALAVEELGLSAELMAEIEGLCRRAMALFPGLNSAGIDILLEAGSHRPFIVEINAQGDLIYNDIYGENRIYMEQVKWALGV